MTDYRYVALSDRESLGSWTRLCLDMDVLSVDSAFVSLAEDEGPLDLLLETATSSGVGALETFFVKRNILVM